MTVLLLKIPGYLNHFIHDLFLDKEKGCIVLPETLYLIGPIMERVRLKNYEVSKPDYPMTEIFVTRYRNVFVKTSRSIESDLRNELNKLFNIGLMEYMKSYQSENEKIGKKFFTKHGLIEFMCAYHMPEKYFSSLYNRYLKLIK